MASSDGKDKKKAARKQRVKTADASLRTAQAVFARFLAKADPAAVPAVTSRN